MRARWLGGLVLVSLLLASAAPRAGALTLVREGNAAFAAGHYERAVDLYTQAEEFSDDPGLVAFNKAAALYELGRFHEAEVHYQRSLEDAQGERLARLQFDRGNSLLRQSGGTHARLLDQAIRSYERCLRQAELAPELADDVRHNLELARALRLRAKDSGEPAQPPANQKKEPQEEPGKTPRSTPSGTDKHVNPDGTGAEKGVGQGEIGKQGVPVTSKHYQAGVGNLPPVPDDEKLAPMSSEEALAHLRRAAERIIRERKNAQRPAAPPSRHTLDW